MVLLHDLTFPVESPIFFNCQFFKNEEVSFVAVVKLFPVLICQFFVHEEIYFVEHCLQ